jgi:nucleoside-diphosphate-sugar epimerase
MKILVSGSKGFIAGYLIEELLGKGWNVAGIDNLSKYGPVDKSYDNHPNYKFVKGDVKNTPLVEELLSDCDHFVAGAAMIGGISYFHEFAYDLLAENERITASSFDAAIKAFKKCKLKKISVMSSSMVFESTNVFPTPEGNQFECPPPLSTYGFQKLATEYFAKGAWEQYKLPYTILRPFNCVGTGEKRALCDKEIKSGNVSLAMSHVVPDLVQKILKGQDPLHILGNGNQNRHYTYGGDLAKGIVATLESDKSINEDFNLSTPVSTSVLELAEMIWKMLRGNKTFRYTSDKPYHYDVQNRVPDVSKAKKLLGFEAATSLETALNEIIPWIENQIKIGGI